MKTTISLSKLAAKILFWAGILASGFISAQKVYDDFEGNCTVKYDAKSSGRFRAVKNPSPDAVNESEKCALYTRTSKAYDNIKVLIPGTLNVESYATYQNAKTIKLKVYTTAPIGTPVEIQLGKQSERPYPDGTHSQYIAHTTVTGAWELLEFRFTEMPRGSKTKATEVNQLTLLFNPGGEGRHKYYFDELTGPGFTAPETVKASEKKKSLFHR